MPSKTNTFRKAISDEPSQQASSAYPQSRPAPIFSPFQARIEEMLLQNAQLPRKQQYTAHRMYAILKAEGYQGAESRIRQFVGDWKRSHQAQQVFLPLDYDPGKDAQCDWGEATAIIGGVKQTVQYFVMRLCYSRRTFVMLFPSQNQESFLYAHVQAFTFFGGVPARISYDNLATAVKLAFDKKDKKHKRFENHTFVAFRSHYLFESHFCTPAAGWEKGQVEHGVKFSRENYLVPIPEAASFEEANRVILERCLQEDKRRVSRQPLTIGQAWEQERPLLQPLPRFAYDCCDMVTVRLTPYSLATYETNRYSVPVRRARREVTTLSVPS